MSFLFALYVTFALSIDLLDTKPRSVDSHSYVYHKKSRTKPAKVIFAEDFQFQKHQVFDRRVNSGAPEQTAEATFYW